MDDKGEIALAAIEILIWELARRNILPAESLANQLDRYHRHMRGSNGYRDRLRVYARMVRVAARSIRGKRATYAAGSDPGSLMAPVSPIPRHHEAT